MPILGITTPESDVATAVCALVEYLPIRPKVREAAKANKVSDSVTNVFFIFSSLPSFAFLQMREHYVNQIVFSLRDVHSPCVNKIKQTYGNTGGPHGFAVSKQNEIHLRQ